MRCGVLSRWRRRRWRRLWRTSLWALWGVPLIPFVVLHALPGAPVSRFEGWGSDPAQRAWLVAQYGFDQPLPLQYTTWLYRALRGQWGQSRFSSRSVFVDVWQATGRTLCLLAWVALVSALLLPLVTVVARHAVPGGETAPRSSLLALVTLPKFLVALVLRDVALTQLEWQALISLPLFDPHYLFNPRFMLLPAVALALTPLLLWYAQGRQSPTSSAWLLWRRFCRDWRLVMGAFLLDVFLVEHVFALRGLGDYGLTALKRHDFPAWYGFSLATALLYGSLRVLLAWGQGALRFSRSPVLPLPPSKPCGYRALGHLLVLLGLALFAGRLAPYSPTDIHTGEQFQLPGHRYVLGTDFLGRDVLSRVLVGFQSCIPRVLGVAALVLGGVLSLRRLARVFPPVGTLWQWGEALMAAWPPWMVFFMAFWLLAPFPHGMEGALALACLAATPAPKARQAGRGRLAPLFARLGCLALVLEVTFFFLHLGAQALPPTWGGDLQAGVSHSYASHSPLPLLAPALAVGWSYYTLAQLHGLVQLAALGPSYAMRWGGWGRHRRKRPATNMTTLIT